MYFFLFQCQCPIPVNLKTGHILTHHSKNKIKDIKRHLVKFMNTHMDWIQNVRDKYLNKRNIKLEDYCNDLSELKYPLDQLGLLILARVYHRRIAVFTKYGIWMTRSDNGLRDCLVYLVFNGGTEFSDTISTGETLDATTVYSGVPAARRVSPMRSYRPSSSSSDGENDENLDDNEDFLSDNEPVNLLKSPLSPAKSPSLPFSEACARESPSLLEPIKANVESTSQDVDMESPSLCEPIKANVESTSQDEVEKESPLLPYSEASARESPSLLEPIKVNVDMETPSLCEPIANVESSLLQQNLESPLLCVPPNVYEKSTFVGECRYGIAFVACRSRKNTCKVCY